MTVEAAFDQAETALIDSNLDTGEGIATDRQHYRDDGVCVNGEMTQGENEGFALVPPNTVSRWHARCNSVSHVSPFGHWSSCTPHWDQETGHEDCDKILGIFGGHYVPPDHTYQEFVNRSGFNTAREWLFDRLIEDGAIFAAAEAHGNQVLQGQCNGVETRSDDGIVYVWPLD